MKNTINKLVLTDFYGTLYPTIAEFTIFSSTHGTFSRIDHMLYCRTDYKTRLSKFKRIETTQSVFSLEKFANVETSNTLLNNQCIKEKKSQMKLETNLRWMKMKTQHAQTYWTPLKQCLERNLYLEMHIY